MNSQPEPPAATVGAQSDGPPQLGAANVKAMTPAQVKAAVDAGQFRDYFAMKNPGGNN